MTKLLILSGALLLSSMYGGEAIHAENHLTEQTVVESEEIPQANPENIAETVSFELPLSGATGFATIPTKVWDTQEEGQVLTTLSAGQAFCILKEVENHWQVMVDGEIGWIEHKYMMINLPDVIPSIIYDNVNAYGSVFRSLGRDLPNITGEVLYKAICFNERLGEEAYTMPIMYETAKKVAKVQEQALLDGNTLVMIESFRPFDTQSSVVTAMYRLMNEDEEVREAISSWGISYFISTEVSSHQKGIAMDVSLAQVLDVEEKNSGAFSYKKVISYEEYEMPTPIHELSPDSASMAYPISSTADWTVVPYSETMNEWAILLQNYCTGAGFSPIASEWWHFNDFDPEIHQENTGLFRLSEVVSIVPSIE